MRKMKVYFLPALAASLVLSGMMPALHPAAEEYYEESYEDSGEEYYEEGTEETEPPLPDSYYYPIESNETAGWPQGPTLQADAAAVMDAETGAFLYSKNMYAKEYPASITKIMTFLVALEHGNLNSKITFSERAVYSLEEGSSHAGIQVGEVMSMKKALYGLMLESANDIANGIAETVGGSLEGFAELMNQKAEELGCVNTHFVNAHGLHNEEHYTCARDMAIITQAALAHPTFRAIAGAENYTCPETNKVEEKRYWYNHNQMIHSDAEYYYEGCEGGKTGFTNDALNTLVTYAKKDGRRLICVELRVNGKDLAYSESHKMLDYGFDNFKDEKLRMMQYNPTRAELLQMDLLGELAGLRTDALDTRVMTARNIARVSIPKDAARSELTAHANADGGLTYTFGGWEVGSGTLAYSPFSYEVPVPQRVTPVYTEIIEETEPGVKGMAQLALRKTKSFGRSAGKGLLALGKKAWAGCLVLAKKAPGWFETAREKAVELINWLNEHDILAAAIGFVILLILLPILIVTWSRNARSVKIRNQRKREREERVRIEESIDSKSVSEIEAELRAELERDRRERQKTE